MSRPGGQDPNERTPMDAALAYASAGWPVFPVAPGAKLPAFPAAHPPGDPAGATCQGECGRPGHGFHDATTDPALIREWWRQNPARNVGIATGAPGPDVLDVDVRTDGSGFAALNRIKRAGLAEGHQALVRTPSTGIHLYYRGTGQRNGSIHGQHIDFRSDGGYVVAPPSAAGGGNYVVVQHRLGQDGTIDWDAIKRVLDPEPLRQQRELAASRGGTSGQGSKGDEGRVERICKFVSERQEGDRNFPVFWGAKQLAMCGQLDDAAVESLVDAALKAGLRGGRREALRSIESGRRDALRNGGGVRGEPDRQRPFEPARQAGQQAGREAG